MYLDIRNGKNIIINELPRQHTYLNSASLGIESGSRTGALHLSDIELIIREGFLPFSENRPDYNTATQVIEAGQIVIAGDGRSASRTYTARNKTAQEIAAETAAAWSVIRSTRNNLLSATDWTQLVDSECAETYTTYRQALRDIPQVYNTPDAVIWPPKPE